jgi:hypothetical protein
VVLLTPASAGAEAKLTLEGGTGHNGSTLTRSFGENREKRTITMIFNASASVTSPPIVVLTDAQDGENLFPGTLSATAEVLGDTIIRVPITVDPGKTSSGTYTTEVLLRGKEIVNKNAKLKLVFKRSPSESLAWVLAFLALALGVALGGLLRWLSTTGTELRSLVGRYELQMALIAGSEWTPAALESALLEVSRLLAKGEVASAETKLTAIESDLPATLSAMNAISSLAKTVGQGEARIREMQGLDADGLRSLLDITDTERQWLAKTSEEAYPETDADKAYRTQHAAWIEEFDLFLKQYADPDKRGGVWADALNLYGSGDFPDAGAKWKTALASQETLRTTVTGPDLPAAFQEGGNDSDAGSSWGSKTKWFAVRHTPTLIGLLFAFGLILVGLRTVFDVKTMFLTDDVTDFFTLMAWGFASGLVGLTTTELATKAMPAASSLT